MLSYSHWNVRGMPTTQEFRRSGVQTARIPSVLQILDVVARLQRHTGRAELGGIVVRPRHTCFVRAGGSVIDAAPCPTEKPAEFRLDAKPITEWWIHLIENGRPRGWLLVTDASAKVVDRKG